LDRQVEIDVVRGQAGERGRGDRDAVVALEAGDDLFFPGRPRALFMYQTSLTWVSFASEPDEQKNTFGDRHRRDLLQLLGKLDRRVVAAAGEQVGEGEPLHLLPRRFHELGVGVAERRAPQAGHALDVGAVLRVVDPDALAPLQDQGAGLAKACEVGVGVIRVSTSRVARFESTGGLLRSGAP
jgi:hypothetical protein